MKRRSMFWALVVALVVVAALPVAANIINQANVTDTCSGYTINVAGKDLSKATTVNYSITLTPTSGSPITITDSIPVAPVPHTGGTWSGTNTQTWAHYGVTLTSSFTLTGTATLVEPKNQIGIHSRGSGPPHRRNLERNQHADLGALRRNPDQFVHAHWDGDVSGTQES